MIEKSSFTYRLFGLNISSEIECPEIPQTKGDPDVFILLNKIPSHFVTNEPYLYFWQTTTEYFYLGIRDLAKYLVINGNQIIIETAHKFDPVALRIFLLGTVFGALLHQRNLFPLHASVVRKNRLTIGFAGKQGIGKSTIAACFVKHGYTLLTDDVCPMTITKDLIPFVQPGYPIIKLSKNSISLLHYENHSEREFHHRTQKYRCQVTAFSHTTSQLNVLVILTHCDHTICSSITPLHGSNKVRALLENTYRLEQIHQMGKSLPHFRYCTDIARNVILFEMKINRERLDPTTMFQLIEKTAADAMKADADVG